MKTENTNRDFTSRRAAIIAMSIAGFLFLFQPFGLSIDHWIEALIVAGFAPLNFIVILSVHRVRIPLPLPQAAMNGGLILVANLLYLLFWSSGGAIFPAILQVFLIGGLTMGAVALWNEQRSLRREVLELKEMPKSSNDGHLVLRGESDTDILNLPRRAIYYVQAQGNYVDVCHLAGGHVKSLLLRAPLTAIAEQAGPEALHQCHRSYLVNLQNAHRLVSDKDGMRIEMPGDLVVPVSRKYREVIRNAVQR